MRAVTRDRNGGNRVSRPKMTKAMMILVLCWLLMPVSTSAGPIDGFNRGVRAFNFWVLDNVIEPVARGYNFVMPKAGQKGVRNFFHNLERPRDIINSSLQMKGQRAARHLGAFLIDSTIGLGGFFRPSERWIEPSEPETFNETLGVYRVPQGGYIILPFLGESCMRCLVGWAADTALYPPSWIAGGNNRTVGNTTARTLGGINFLARQMPHPREGSEEEWQRYLDLIHDRPMYEQAKELFRANLNTDVGM